MVMDVAGMVADLRLELDRIERSILILEELASPNRTHPAPPLNRGNASPARLPDRRTASVRSARVVSIERSTNRPVNAAAPSPGSAEQDLSRKLRELRAQTAKFRQAISALDQTPGG